MPGSKRLEQSHIQPKTTEITAYIHLYNMREARTMLLQMHSVKPVSKDYVTSLTNLEKIPVHHITQIAPTSIERLQEIYVKQHPRITHWSSWPKIVHEGWSKTVPIIFSHIGMSEMKLHVKMASCQNNHVIVWKKFYPQGTTYRTLYNW